ncbi:MAG: DoxX family protein [Acidobacteriota bacterium]
MKFSRHLPDVSMFLLRASAGLMLAFKHGDDKIAAAYGHLFQGQEWGFINGVANLGFPFPTFFAVCAAVAEFFGALFLAAGLFTRYAAALVTANMAVAVYNHLRSDMRFELAAMYGLVALAFIFTSPGRFSIDGLWRGRAKS